MNIKEFIIVEGRDDTRAIKEAVSCNTIETHGYGISQNTFSLIEKAYQKNGIIIFTDPDCVGEQIRKRLSRRFPKAKHAYLKRDEAEKNGDIGIENAKPEDIIFALKTARATALEESEIFSHLDLIENGLVGLDSSKEKRRLLGKLLGIGYGNGNSFLKKLNGFGITREEFTEAISKMEKGL